MCSRVGKVLQEQDSPHLPAEGGKGRKMSSAAFSDPIWYQMDTPRLTQDGPSFSGTFLWNRAFQTWEYLGDGTFCSLPFPQEKKGLFPHSQILTLTLPFNSSPLRVTGSGFLSPQNSPHLREHMVIPQQDPWERKHRVVSGKGVWVTFPGLTQHWCHCASPN